MKQVYLVTKVYLELALISLDHQGTVPKRNYQRKQYIRNKILPFSGLMVFLDDKAYLETLDLMAYLDLGETKVIKEKTVVTVPMDCLG